MKADGDKIIFVADDSGKSWEIVNPGTLKDHVGHHVELSAHIYKDKGQIHVMKVTMAPTAIVALLVRMGRSKKFNRRRLVDSARGTETRNEKPCSTNPESLVAECWRCLLELKEWLGP